VLSATYQVTMHMPGLRPFMLGRSDGLTVTDMTAKSVALQAVVSFCCSPPVGSWPLRLAAWAAVDLR
jgi:hypothetical protein